jgi:hypothetical protein
VAAAALSLPAIGFIVVEVAGQDIGLLGEDGALTFVGRWIFWPLVLLSLAFNTLKARADKYQSRALRDGHFLYLKLLDAVNITTQAKLDRFTRFVSEYRNQRSVRPFRLITKPTEHMRRILENLQFLLSELSGIPRADICLSLAVRLDTTKTWEWLLPPTVDNDLGIADLVRDKRSAFRGVVEGANACVVIADKRLGAEQGRYVPSPRDESYGRVGSAICRKLVIDAGEECVTAVLSISTFGKLLFAPGDTDTPRKIETVLLPAFDIRLRLELCLLYIQRVIAA